MKCRPKCSLRFLSPLYTFGVNLHFFVYNLGCCSCCPVGCTKCAQGCIREGEPAIKCSCCK
uniref:Metallothionein n=1 Tax=Salvator merianae TaxID=96440 RepID=A0A8D0AXT0_SALMN